MADCTRPPPRAGRGPRDVMITGIGFCLPGQGGRVHTADDLWAVAARGASCLIADGSGPPHAPVRLSAEDFQALIPDIPGTFSRHFTDAHRFGLLSLVYASADAGLDFRAGDLSAAAILTGRGSIETNLAIYAQAMQTDYATMAPADAIDHFIAGMQGGTPSDVTLVQAALTRATGPCFTVSSGCGSSAAQVSNAALMIASGAADIAVVSGVDTLNADVLGKGQQLLELLYRAAEADPAAAGYRLPPLTLSLMRPYDRRGDCSNIGEGAATVILESRQHADRRGARCRGQILSHVFTRDGLPHPLTGDETGRGLVSAVRRCLGQRWPVEQIPYVHGASNGDEQTTIVECEAIRELYGPAAGGLLMTSQEACFGHTGAPSGCLGLALITLMMEHGQVCPTANCEEPADGLPFDPVPGTTPRPLDFDHALNFTYQPGGGRSVILVGGPDVP